MEAAQKRVPIAEKLLHTRNGTLTLAAIAAVLAGIVLIAFLRDYKSSVTGDAAATSALVASSLIPKGTSGDVVIGDTLFKPTTVSEENLVDGAVASASTIAGKVAVRDVYPGEQITAADFAGEGDPLRGKLGGNERAVSVPIDTAQGLVGRLRNGDRIDVLAGFRAQSGRGTVKPETRTLMQNVLVLAVPKDVADNKPDEEAAVTLRVTEKQAAALAFASDNGKLWFSLRPPAGASQSRPSSVNLDSLLEGTAAVPSEAAR